MGGEIARFSDGRRAYLGRKAVRYLPERPYYVLGVELGRWYQFRTSKQNREVIHSLATRLPFPGETWILQLNRRTRRIRKQLKRMPGAELAVR